MQPRGKKTVVWPLVANVAMVGLGIVFALGLAELLFRAFPNVVPAEVRVNPPARRVKALIDETYDLKQSDGDLYHFMKGKVVPASPDDDPVIAHIHMVTDANGFRNPPSDQATYDIVALGDSFTKASGVTTPWTQKLAEDIEWDVLNLGEVGLGPQDELNVLQQYGLKKHPKWVILAYFEGNDLYDAAAYDQANPFIVTRFGRFMLNQSLDAWHSVIRGGAHEDPASQYLYPLSMTVNNQNMDMVFFSYYISWLSVDRPAIESSQNYRIATETILRMRDLSEAAGSHFLLVYLPSKEHIYLPYLDDAELSKRVFNDVPAIGLDAAGFLQFEKNKATPELTREHMDDQSRVMADFAAENKMLFLDLTPIFQQEAARGGELYYPFDSHWNQHGHDLAAQTIADYMGLTP